MAQNIAIESLLKEKARITAERESMFAKLSLEIVEIDTAIERLSGKRVWEVNMLKQIESLTEENKKKTIIKEVPTFNKELAFNRIIMIAVALLAFWAIMIFGIAS